ncbi:MAG: class I SAM-dependent methyltransferase [Candidatus Bathyarchaeota archaeon]|nr:class I SAM-dependent methyltransferase [Candidatus Bathyarchaeota archaeon]
MNKYANSCTSSTYKTIKGVKNFYNKIANSYDVLYKNEQEKKYNLALTLLNNKKLEGNILDAGCGTGLFEEFFKSEKENLAFFCVDISDALLRKLKYKTKNKYFNVFLVRCNIHDLPFRSNTFDYCLMFTVLQNLPKPVLALKEVKRTLKKNAYIVVTGLKVKYTPTKLQKILLKAGFKSKVVNNSTIGEYIAIGKPREYW